MAIHWTKVKPSRLEGPKQWLGGDRFVIDVIRNSSGRALRFTVSDKCNPKLSRGIYRGKLMDAKQFCEDILKNELRGCIHPRTELVKAVRNDWDSSTQDVLLKLIDYIDYKFDGMQKEIERVEKQSENDMDELRRSLRAL
jgi:hypothetical protein